MAITIEDGSVVGRYGRGRGEGPGELRQVVNVATTSDGVLVSDGTRVNHWRMDGTWWGPIVHPRRRRGAPCWFAHWQTNLWCRCTEVS